MATDIGNLAVRLSADIAQFQNQLNTAATSVAGFSGKATKSLDMVKNAFLGLAAFQGIGKIIDLQNEVGDMQDFAEGVGMSTTALQELQYAGLGSGVTIDNFEKIIMRMGKAASEAADGEEKFADAFKALNISVMDTQGNFKSTDALIMEVIGSLEKVPNASDRIRLATTLAGREGALALSKLAAAGVTSIEELRKKAHELGIVLNEDLVKRGGDVGDRFAQIGMQIEKGLQRAIIENNGALESMGEIAARVFPKLLIWATDVAKAFDVVGTAIGTTLAKMQGYETGEDKLARRKEDLTKLSAMEAKYEAERAGRKDYNPKGWRDKTLATQIEGTRIEIAKAKKDIDDLVTYEEKALKKITKATETKATPHVRVSTPKGNKTKPDVDENERQVDNLLKSTDIAKLTEYNKQLSILEKRASSGAINEVELFQATKKLNEAFADVNGLKARQTAQEENQKALDEWVDKSREADKANQSAAQSIRELIDPAQKLNREMVAAAELVKSGDLTNSEYIAYYNKLIEKTDDAKSAAKELGNTFTSAFEDAIAGGKSFRTILGGLAQDIAKIVARRLITEPLGNFITKGLSTLIPSANGNVFSQGNLMPFAAGGVFAGPTMFPLGNGSTGWAGEAGANSEAIMPLKRINGKLGVLASGGAGSSISMTPVYNITQNINGGADPKATGDAAATALMRIIANQEISAAQRVGGQLNRMNI